MRAYSGRLPHIAVSWWWGAYRSAPAIRWDFIQYRQFGSPARIRTGKTDLRRVRRVHRRENGEPPRNPTSLLAIRSRLSVAAGGPYGPPEWNRTTKCRFRRPASESHRQGDLVPRKGIEPFCPDLKDQVPPRSNAAWDDAPLPSSCATPHWRRSALANVRWRQLGRSPGNRTLLCPLCKRGVLPRELGSQTGPGGVSRTHDFLPPK